ncbi:MAG: FHA domain-containing protein [Pirellulaceae bacterium]|nr:FHA domain-containing protein [Pirellulaceae bacterium]
MKLKLTAFHGLEPAGQVEISHGQCITFGRTSDAQNSYEADRHMSRVHFEIDFTGRHAELSDRGSSNGTFVNGSKISGKQRLTSGDKIRAGCTTFEVLIDQGTQQPSSNPLAEVVRDSRFESRSGASRQLANADSPRDSSSVSAKVKDVARKAEDSKPISPISESSLIESVNVADTTDPSVSSSEGAAHQGISDTYRLFSKRFTTELAVGLPIIADRLSKEWSVQFVLHPRKIRHDISMHSSNTIRLWNWNSATAEIGPIVVSWTEFKVHYITFMPRYLAADALVIYLGRNSAPLQQELRELTERGVQGFSEPGGFLSCFWPSSLATMLEVGGPSACQQLFQGNIAGALMASPWDNHTALLAANQQLSESLLAFHFETCTQFRPT